MTEENKTIRTMKEFCNTCEFWRELDNMGRGICLLRTSNEPAPPCRCTEKAPNGKKYHTLRKELR